MADKKAIVDFADWSEYFRKNKDQLAEIAWNDPYGLSASERAIIADSIQQFQLGESSEGRHLLFQARAYAERSGDYAYLEAITAFIREEQRHARDLGQFMKVQQIPLIRAHWVDGVFRKLRKFAGLELSVTVLITAEIIAKVYYEALKNCTKSPALRGLCDQILRDENKHVEFQSLTLRKLAAKQGAIRHFLSRAFHRILFEGTILVVWRQHRKVFKTGGFGVLRYLKSCHEEYRASAALIAGKSASATNTVPHASIQE
ncbi:hypothetical protein [Paenibacillus sp. NPDC058071]|uniref:hypothetical protein n=1 Tax=Paenibacillus sp. NPDC058071 TaxID=3346326 RepID=UPI0036DE688A